MASAPALAAEQHHQRWRQSSPAGSSQRPELFRKETGTEVRSNCATATIQRRVGGGEAADVGDPRRRPSLRN